MKKELEKELRVCFELSLLLKECGFDWKTTEGFILYGDDELWYDQFYLSDHYSELLNNPNHIPNPTQAFAQKFIRKVLNINVESNLLRNVDKYKCLFIPMDLKKPKENKTYKEAFIRTFPYLGKNYHDTYEGALEEGLFEACKLHLNEK